MPALIRIAALCGLLLFLGSLSASAYTIVFKDGSTVIAKEKYRVDGDRALVKLPSGTETFFRLEDIDLPNTEKMNEIELGTAIVLEGGENRPFEALRGTTASLRDLLLERARSGPAPAREPTAPTVSTRTTPSGNLDFSSLPKRPFEPEDSSQEILALLRQQGLPISTVLQGSQPGRILVEVFVDNRGEVFETLQECASAFVDTAARFPEIEAMELIMNSSTRSRAGQFVVSPQDALDLVEGRIDPPAYFFANVLF